MDRLDVMRLFTRIVECQSFTLAAQDMDIPRSTATQVIQQLEARLRVRLLQRTTRHVRVTLDGDAYYRRCVSILSEVEDTDAAFSNAKPRGLLRVDVHGTLARHFLLPALPQFLAEYPDIMLHLASGDRLVDLVREGFDCVLRVGDLQDSAMVGRRVALLEEVTCASPGYFERYGKLESVEQLRRDGHRAIGFVSSATGRTLPLEFVVEGQLRKIDLPATLTVTSAETYVTAAKLGLGLIQMPRYHIEDALAAGTLVIALPKFPPTPTPVSLLYPHSRQLSPRVRVFLDWISRVFSARAQSVLTAE
jgi:DNA-binding transcriptional LysR family regulator